MRVALDDAAPLYRDAPEAQSAQARGADAVLVFMREILPAVLEEARVLAADVIKNMLSAGGKQFSETKRAPAEIETYAGAMADMFCSYLKELGATR